MEGEILPDIGIENPQSSVYGRVYMKAAIAGRGTVRGRGVTPDISFGGRPILNQRMQLL